MASPGTMVSSEKSQSISSSSYFSPNGHEPFPISFTGEYPVFSWINAKRHSKTTAFNKLVVIQSLAFIFLQKLTDMYWKSCCIKSFQCWWIPNPPVSLSVVFWHLHMSRYPDTYSALSVSTPHSCIMNAVMFRAMLRTDEVVWYSIGVAEDRGPSMTNSRRMAKVIDFKKNRKITLKWTENYSGARPGMMGSAILSSEPSKRIPINHHPYASKGNGLCYSYLIP